MTLNASRQEKLDTVLKSPAAVAIHDRNAWISIFAQYNVVEDPVGSQPHHSGAFDAGSGVRGNGALERFFDTFIAPNDIKFHVDRDIVCDNHVLRDLTIEINMSDKVNVKVPMHLLYELCEEGGEPRIARLAAHWELWPMIKQLFAKGSAAYSVLLALGVRMMKIQGLGGALGFSKGFLGIGKRGPEVVSRFIEAFNANSTARIADLFDPLNKGVAFPYGQPVFSPVDMADSEDCHLSSSKVLVAGYTTTATVELSRDGQMIPGLAVFEFNSKTKNLNDVRFYWED